MACETRQPQQGYPYLRDNRTRYDNKLYHDYIMDTYEGRNLIVKTTALFDIALAEFLTTLALDSSAGTTG